MAAGEVNISPMDHSVQSVKDVGIVVAKDGKWFGLSWILGE